MRGAPMGDAGSLCSGHPHRRTSLHTRKCAMLKWALIFFLISLVAGVFGFTGIAAGAAAIAKVLFFIFVVLFVVFLVLGLTIAKTIS
jgi:uncharacterized membrane protein YtjA (UPF0391 family)